MALAASTHQILWLSFAIAFGFGALAQQTRFCTMGAIADIVHTGDWGRMRAWLLASGIAILGAAALHQGGLINLDQSIYRTPRLIWLSHLIGGLCFGAGMVLASGCGAKTLMRVGSGNLKSLVVLIVSGLVAYMSLRGLLAVFRVGVLDPVAIVLPTGQDLPALLHGAGLSRDAALWSSVVALGGGLTAAGLARRSDWQSTQLLGGIGTGLAVVAAWYVSGYLGHVAEHPETLEEAFLATNSGRMEALTFVAPPAFSLELLMLWSDSSRKLTIGITSLLGVISGSALWSVPTRNFRWEGFSSLEDTAAHLIGAALMGFGGVTAMGCTIGQGISGVSTLALGSILTFCAIVTGAVLTLRWQDWRLARMV